MILNPYAIVIDVYATLGGKQPGSSSYADHKAYINANGQAAYLTALDGMFAAQTNATMSATMLTNLGLASVFTAAQGEAYLAANAGNRVKAALDLASSLTNYAGADAAILAAKTTYVTTTANSYTYASNTANTSDAVASAVAVSTGQSFVLTTTADTFNGTAGDDTFTAAETTAVTLSLGDNLNGGLGDDILNVSQTAAIAAAVPVGATIAGIETINYSSAAAITANTTTINGVTAITTLNSGANNVIATAAATTDVTVTNATIIGGTVAVNGGKNVVVTTGQSTASGGAGGAIGVGATTAAAGTVTVTNTGTSGNVTGGSTATNGAITIVGGTSITAAQTNTSTAAANATVLTGNITVNNTAGAVSVTGDASTTDVTVTQSAAITAVASGTIGRIGIINGTVSVLDANRASTTAAGTIETVTITNAAAATVNSGALKTLNLGGTLTTVNAGTSGALTTAANSVLALNLTGAVSTGAVTLDTDFTTVNVSGNTTASTIADLVSAAITTINVSGDAKVTFTDYDPATITAINVTNTGGAAFGTSALAVTTVFTGGDGADEAIFGASTVASTMGAGNDIVTYGGALGTGGSVDAGTGIDTIIMSDTEAAAADGSSVFNTAFSNFNTLQIEDAFVADALDLDGINGVTAVTLTTGVSGTAAINNLASGGTVKFQADGANTPTLTIGVKSALVGSTDVLNLDLSKSGVLATGDITSSNVETINITTTDAVAAGSAAAIHVMSLLAANEATAITVNGNNGLTITAATGSVKVTDFDASGVIGNSTAASTFVAATTDTAANLGVTYASLNSTANAVVSIKGGAGEDTLTGSTAAINLDTITGGEGADIITGGTGADNIILTETTAAVDQVVLTEGITMDTVTGFKAGATTGDKFNIDISALETAAQIIAGLTVNLVHMVDGTTAMSGTGVVQEVADQAGGAAVAAGAGAEVFVLLGETYANAAAVETGLEVGDHELTVHTSAAQNDAFLVVWSDGTDAYLSAATMTTDGTDFTTGDLTVTNMAKLVGISSIAAGDFVTANFDIV